MRFRKTNPDRKENTQMTDCSINPPTPTSGHFAPRDCAGEEVAKHECSRIKIIIIIIRFSLTQKNSLGVFLLPPRTFESSFSKNVPGGAQTVQEDWEWVNILQPLQLVKEILDKLAHLEKKHI